MAPENGGHIQQGCREAALEQAKLPSVRSIRTPIAKRTRRQLICLLI